MQARYCVVINVSVIFLFASSTVVLCGLFSSLGLVARMWFTVKIEQHCTWGDRRWHHSVYNSLLSAVILEVYYIAAVKGDKLRLNVFLDLRRPRITLDYNFNLLFVHIIGIPPTWKRGFMLSSMTPLHPCYG